MNRQVIVIGAGIGGLSAAIRLAAAGRRVIVLEQNEAVGGKMRQVEAAGFRWDTGPSVITMRGVFEELFAAAGRRLDDYLALAPVEPLTRYFYEDGATLDVTRDWPALADQIAVQFGEREVEGYAAYLAYAARLHRITGPLFIYGERPGLHSLRRVTLADALRLEPWLRMHAAIGRAVRSTQLRQLLGRFATYVGASPYTAPATLGVISHVELTQGVWYPRGGVFTIAAALARLAGELGVDVRTGCRVEQVIVKDGRASGVALADGSSLQADAVLSDVDVATVYNRLLPVGAVSAARAQRLARAKMSCSGFVLLLGVRGPHPRLAHHNIFFCRDYRQEFADIFGRGAPAAAPTIYLAITSKTDPADAPPGHENWYILVNAPALGPGFDWRTRRAAYRDLVLAQLARFGIDVSAQIAVERVLTPLDLEARTGSWRGALYGELFDSPWVAFRRPTSRAGDIRGLYLAGGTVHPGGGVPMVALSGRLAAQAILADLA
jgi:phytoene desaturase